jgi:hypothetical protein
MESGTTIPTFLLGMLAGIAFASVLGPLIWSALTQKGKVAVRRSANLQDPLTLVEQAMLIPMRVQKQTVSVIGDERCGQASSSSITCNWMVVTSDYFEGEAYVLLEEWNR